MDKKNSNPKSSKSKAEANVPANKKLSRSMLHITAIQVAPTVIEVELNNQELSAGATREIEVSDPVSCLDCVRLRPLYRMQCLTCKGLGYIDVDRKISVDLPAGTTVGQKISYPELGRYDLRAGKNGDLIIKIKTNNQPNANTDGKNISYILPVSLQEALLGARIEVPVVDGTVMIKLSPLTRPGKVYLLKGNGVDGGDLMITIKVLIPEVMTLEDSELLDTI